MQSKMNPRARAGGRRSTGRARVYIHTVPENEDQNCSRAGVLKVKYGAGWQCRGEVEMVMRYAQEVEL